MTEQQIDKELDKLAARSIDVGVDVVGRVMKAVGDINLSQVEARNPQSISANGSRRRRWIWISSSASVAAAVALVLVFATISRRATTLNTMMMDVAEYIDDYSHRQHVDPSATFNDGLYDNYGLLEYIKVR